MTKALTAVKSLAHTSSEGHTVLINLPRMAAWVQAKISRVWKRQLTVGGLVSALITLVAFVAVTIAPYWRAIPQDLPTTSRISLAVKAAWLAIFAAIYLKYSDRVKRTKALDKVNQKRKNKRQVHIANSLRTLRQSFDPAGISNLDVRAFREQVLEAAAASVEELLGCTASEEVVANLMEFTDQNLMHMQVTCRSQKHRGDGRSRPREELIAFAAIKDQSTKMIDDICADPLHHAGDNSKYRAILALPMRVRGVTYGCLTIDSERAYEFYGRTNEIAVQLAPYAMTLALTFRNEGFYYEHQNDTGSRT